MYVYPNGLWRAFKRAWDRSSGGPEDKLLDRQRRHTPTERHFTCHFLFLPLDTSPDSQSWQPPWNQRRQSINDLTLYKRAIHRVVNLISTTTETHDNAHAPTTRIQHSNIQDLKLTSQTLYHLTMHRHPPRAFYTLYHNIYSLKLLPLTLYQYNIHQKRMTIIYIKIFTTAISKAKGKKRIYAYPNGLWWTFKRQVVQWRWRQPTWQAETTHTPRTTFHLPLHLPPSRHQPWQPKLTTTLKINEDNRLWTTWP